MAMRPAVDAPLLFVLACSLSLLAACTRDETDATSVSRPLPPRAGTLVFTPSFSDEFDGNGLTPTKWFAWTGDLRHKSTINAALPSLASARDGSMFVSAVASPENKAFPYSTGYIDTHGLFAQTYGTIEFRARSQHAPGVWYALWGRSWTNLVPELDIELLAENTTQVWFVNHWGVAPLPPDERRGFTTVDGMDITKFHTYTITWTSELVEWAIDGKPYRRVTDPALVPHEPMFWVMNAWVGGWGGTPGPATIFPANLEVDYVRISRLGTWSTEPLIRIANPKKKMAGSETIDVELADFGDGAHVEVWEGPTLVGRLRTPPFRFESKALPPGPHPLTFVGTDGERRATTSIDVTVE